MKLSPKNSDLTVTLHLGDLTISEFVEFKIMVKRLFGQTLNLTAKSKVKKREKNK